MLYIFSIVRSIRPLQTSSGNSGCGGPPPVLWEQAPPELVPPLEFTKERVRECYDDFVGRVREEIALVDGLKEVFHAVGELLR